MRFTRLFMPRHSSVSVEELRTGKVHSPAGKDRLQLIQAFLRRMSRADVDGGQAQGVLLVSTDQCIMTSPPIICRLAEPRFSDGKLHIINAYLALFDASISSHAQKTHKRVVQRMTIKRLTPRHWPSPSSVAAGSSSLACDHFRSGHNRRRCDSNTACQSSRRCLGRGQARLDVLTRLARNKAPWTWRAALGRFSDGVRGVEKSGAACWRAPAPGILNPSMLAIALSDEHT